MKFILFLSILFCSHGFFGRIHVKSNMFYDNIRFSPEDSGREYTHNILKLNESIDPDNSTDTFEFPNINPILPKSPSICCLFPPFPPPEEKKNIINNIIYFLENLKEFV